MRTRQGGFTPVETLVGVAVALSAIATSLVLVRGLQHLAVRVARDADRAAAAQWALDRIAREVARAGLGTCPGREANCPDERLELLGAGWIGVRADLDRDDPEQAAEPEQALAGAFTRTDTGNDEVVVFLRRGRGLARAAFEADLESSARSTSSAGEMVAPRDGRVERIDAGPADLPGEGGRGTLYRVTFVNDARHIGTPRFRVAEPLADDTLDFAVRAWDGRGVPVAPCGGLDDATGRACRATVRRVALELTIGRAGGRPQTFRREVAVGGPW
ncbi:MAG: hypothetical protein MUC67_00270 [Acidobacteria bacterium]|jgi:hypothetical protein|nr:hypothetical protein [Acidobacteriota bacterium]MCU0253135.1 hypothetical protein [Acidobacteriota bacterium]